MSDVPELFLAAIDLRAAREALDQNPQYHLAVAVQLAKRKHDMLRREVVRDVNVPTITHNQTKLEK